MKIEDGKFLLILAGNAEGSWRQVHGSIQVNKGKLGEVDVEAHEAPLWLVMLACAQAAIELKHLGQPMAEAQKARRAEQGGSGNG